MNARLDPMRLQGTFDGLADWSAFGRSRPAGCRSEGVPDDEPFAALVAEQWEGMEEDGPLWLVEGICELVGVDRNQANVECICTPELDTYAMCPGALLQVLFGRADVADRDILAAAKALRELLQAYGDGEAERRANHVITMERV